jgi:hypothetical protein
MGLFMLSTGHFWQDVFPSAGNRIRLNPFFLKYSPGLCLIGGICFAVSSLIGQGMPVENRIIAIRLGFSLTTVSVFLNHMGGPLSFRFRGRLVLPLLILELLRPAD